MDTKIILSQKLACLIEEKKNSEYRKSVPKQADEMDIPYQTLVKYINGRNECSISNLAKLSNYYGVSSDYLLGLSEVKSVRKPSRVPKKVTNT